ncbi:MAG: helix-turn-helix domain-containing protein, partial [Anaerorhabdus sp.]|uniref:helix-turn-helix domain-containing protein n=1 Tax=Anaerorhabdus sp. TaxID=1872524 RepID=UPI003A874557
MKLTRDQRIEIYNLRKNGRSYSELSKQFKINVYSIKYLVRLIDKHGIEILRKDRNRFYSKDF